jgi:uncharacterized protein (DUF427 family)
MKAPSADHPIGLRPNPRRVRVKAEGHVIADSADALMLAEAAYPPVAYLPRADVEMGFLSKTDRRTHCPYKGEASYFSLHIEGRILENVIWSYEDPYPAVEGIKDRLAFYPDKVEIYEVDPETV